MSDLPEPTSPTSPPVAAPRLTPEQFEAVIRRATQLQAGQLEEGTADGVSRDELIRIGREIGLSPRHLQQALAEQAAGDARVDDWPSRIFGIPMVAASRTVPGDADEVREQLDRYLCEREWLAPVRRFPDRTVYQKGRGLDVARVIDFAQVAMGGPREPEVGAGFKLRDTRRVEVTVQPLESGFSYVAIRVDLRNSRVGLGAAGVVGGWGIGGTAAAALAIAVAPPAALLALPVIGGAMWGSRAIQNHIAEHAQTHLDSLLDALERGERLITRPRRR